jgi:hypothetical protein
VSVRRLLPLAVIAFLLTAGQALAATQILPDLVEQTPANISASGGQLTFDSEVVNRGNGPLTIHGHRSSASGNMTADQVINMSDGSTQTVGGIGQLHYETSFGHQHWHFMPFNHYELHKLDGTLIGTDVKQGFCLGDNESHGGLNRVFTDWCRQNHPEAVEVTEGLSPGFGDKYQAGLEKQYIPINPTQVPAGNYTVVHRVNPDHAVHETNYGNNVASVEVQISWSGSSASAKLLKSCPGTAVCGSPTNPPPPPPPPTTTTSTTTSTHTTSTSTHTTSTSTQTVTTTTTTTTTPPTLTQNVIPPISNDAVGPQLSFTSSRSERFRARSSALWLFASCNEQCRITAQGSLLFGGSARTLKSGVTTMTLAPDTRAKLVLTLRRSYRKAIRRALAHHRRVRANVTLTVLDESGNRTTIVRHLKLTR